MFLNKLTLVNFKNYTEASLSFSDKLNCFIGDNGVGKTNILDAIHYLSFCKSYFNSIDTQNILHDEAFFSIHGFYNKNGNKTDKISCVQKRGHRKQFKLNNKEYDRLADHIGMFPLVMTSPSDINLIHGGSDERRKYLDSVISQFDKLYLDDLINYNKVLNQRNSLLRSFAENHSFDKTSLAIWDEQLIRLGNVIHKKREDFFKELNPIFQQYFETISGGREKVSLIYDSQLFQGDFPELLDTALNKDRIMRFSTVGIHKDDLKFNIGDYPIKKFGSQGQQKSFLIAIKLAQFEYTKKMKGFKPVLLFDDIFDKLDDFRVKHLIELVGNNNFGQVFITDTQKERIARIFTTVNVDHKIFKIENGIIEEIE
ncbi:MAG: DNA replication/repair protein RecF [Bacteroidales bacterium]|nr:DNA replication/repair protein RecF [Bacteroidales bacterium]